MVTQFGTPIAGVVVTAGQKAVTALGAMTELVLVGQEIARAELGVKAQFRLESLSRSAGTLLFEGGVVGSVDDGIVLYHERVTQDKPALRKLLRRIDERQGRVPKRKASKAQKIVRAAVATGQVNRGKDGRLRSLKRIAVVALKAEKRRELKAKAAARTKRAAAFKRRIGLRR